MPLPNYDIPDTSKGDYYCALCDARMNCLAMWESHKIGKRHITNVKKPPGQGASKVKAVYVDDVPLIAELLDSETEPIVGLDYVCETRRADANLEPFYNCYICQSTGSQTAMFAHLVTLKHRIAYLRKVDPRTAEMALGFGLPNSQLDPMIRNICFEKEAALGRGNMEVKVEKSHGQVAPAIRHKMKIINPIKFDSDTKPWNSLLPTPNEPPARTGQYFASKQEFSPREISYSLSGPTPSVNESKAASSMNISYEVKSKPEKSKINVETAAASSSKTRVPSPEPSASRSPTPEFQLDLEKHNQHLTPYHVQGIIKKVFEEIERDPACLQNEMKLKHFRLCLSLQFASLVDATYKNATPEKKKLFELKLSEQGNKERERRKLEALRIPGFLPFSRS